MIEERHAELKRARLEVAAHGLLHEIFRFVLQNRWVNE
jgi:hypothetical protein